jgi:hypothetical protein
MRTSLIRNVFIALWPCIAGAQSTDAVLLTTDQTVAGKSQEEWSAAWWQWAASFDDDDSPVADRTGRMCGSKQSGSVWFLAGTYGTARTTRTCTVPAGKHLFFPLINYVVFPREGSQPSCGAVMRDAAEMTNDVSALVLDVDGKRFGSLVQYRLVTKRCFDLGARSEPPEKIFPAAGNGYYVMLKPLTKGKHVINFGGVLPGMAQAVTYTLLVE